MVLLGGAAWLAFADRGSSLPQPIPPTLDEVLETPREVHEVRSATRSEADDRSAAVLADELRALARLDPHAFLTRVDTYLSASDAQRLAAIIVWSEDQSRDTVGVLARALLDPKSSAVVLDLVLERLAPRTAADGRARQALIDFLRTTPAKATHRAAAFAGVLQWGTEDDAQVCMKLLDRDAEPDVVLDAARALASNRDATARRHAESLQWRHPDAEVRRRLRSLGIGR